MVSIVEEPTAGSLPTRGDRTLTRDKYERRCWSRWCQKMADFGFVGGYVSNETSVAWGFAEEVVSSVANLGRVPSETTRECLVKERRYCVWFAGCSRCKMQEEGSVALMRVEKENGCSGEGGIRTGFGLVLGMGLWAHQS